MMRTELIEIYSDASNAAIMRHPGRRFPGVLIQGDSLHILCSEADEACKKISRGAPGYEAANYVRNALWSYLLHYKQTLVENGIPLPFSDDGR
jgi:hypothetical protein